MNLFRDLERNIDEKLRSLFKGSNTSGDQRRELIEIQRSILDDIAEHAQLLPRARRVLPFNFLTIRIPVPEEDRRNAFRVVFVEGGALRAEIAAHLKREEIEASADLAVDVVLLEESVPDLAGKGFSIIYTNREKPAVRDEEVPDSTPPRVRFTIISGQAEQAMYEFAKARIHIGRIGEVLDDRKRPIRRNDIVFIENAEAPNSTVSRAHAHIEWQEAQRQLRIFDDGSSYGTSVLHEGRILDVSSASGRGLKLVSGDEIYFGQARVRYEIV